MRESDKNKIPAREITPPHVYFNRRSFMRTGIVVATAVATGALYRELNGLPQPRRRRSESPEVAEAPTSQPAAATDGAESTAGFTTTETKTSRADITSYNNYYEFSTDKDAVAEAAAGFDTRDWKVSVEGLVSKPRVFDMDDILKLAAAEERVYRMRCVEGWSMVVPWSGYSFSKLLASVKPLAAAKYVAFETLLDAKRMPGQKTRVLDWPYVEGLRLDEAMHPLTLLTTGLYGKPLPPQDGAPVRMIIPWKYGFKGIKSIVKIKLVDKEPTTTWSRANPREYGFYANVNPKVDHPRWSQATERRIGENGRRKTLMFNGYEEQVASLYTGMDLKKNF